MKSMMVVAMLTALAASSAIAGQGRPLGTQQTAQPTSLRGAQTATYLSPAERGEYARQMLRTFEPELRAQGSDVSAFARKLGRAIGLADAANVQNAAVMPTLETALAALKGQRVNSAAMKSSLRLISSGESAAKLGSSIADTTFTPLPKGRCRVADSRNAPATALPADTDRGIDVEDLGGGTYAFQGGTGNVLGENTDVLCGIPSIATAYVVSVTALTLGGTGFLKVFENGKDYRTGNTVYFTPANSASNDVIVTSCQTCALELTVRASAPVHYVLDVIGYFMPPEATELECVDTADTNVALAAGGGFGSGSAPACPAGYTQTSTSCLAGNFNDTIVGIRNGTCWARGNTNASSFNVRAKCCRVPGR